MIASKQITLHDHVVDVTTQYLGPAAQRFIDRHIETHLEISPDELTKADLEKLVDWVKLSVALLSEDKALIDEFTGKLLDLAGKASGRENAKAR